MTPSHPHAAVPRTHAHAQAVWNALHWGHKLWALTPPAKAAFAPAGQHPLDSGWYSAWRCIIRAAAQTAARTRMAII